MRVHSRRYQILWRILRDMCYMCQPTVRDRGALRRLSLKQQLPGGLLDWKRQLYRQRETTELRLRYDYTILVFFLIMFFMTR